MKFRGNKERRLVCICLPAYSTINVHTWRSLENNIANLRKRQVMVAEVLGQGTYVHEARNHCVEQAYRDLDALGQKWTHLMFIDADMSFGDDIVWNLMERKVDIVGGLYVQKSSPFMPVAGILQPDGVRYNMSRPDVTGKSGEMVKVDMVGTGLLMVRRRVFDTLEPPWFWFKPMESPKGMERRIADGRAKRFDILGEDVTFCREARDAGFDVWLDLKNDGVHLGNYGYCIKDYLYPDPEKLAEAEAARKGWALAEQEA